MRQEVDSRDEVMHSEKNNNTLRAKLSDAVTASLSLARSVIGPVYGRVCNGRAAYVCVCVRVSKISKNPSPGLLF